MNDVEFVMVKKRLQALTGIDLDAYKTPQVRRRLDGYLSRLRISTWPDFVRYLGDEPDAAYRLRDFLAINVSSFFRDGRKWAELRDVVLPELCARTRMVRAWSAACSIGAEAYSLAMLFENRPALGRCRVIGTDIDRAALVQAREGGPYRPDQITEVPPDLLSRHFKQAGGQYWIQPPLKERVTFTEMDLLQAQNKREFDLILCRNVLIYFTEDAKRQVLTALALALKQGGILFIGATESIPHEQTIGLARIGLSFYRRVA